MKILFSLAIFFFSLSAFADINLDRGDSVTIGGTRVTCDVQSSGQCTQFSSGIYCATNGKTCAQFSSGVYCGYSCEQFSSGVYCGERASHTCDQYSSGVYCGINCQQFSSGVFCAAGGLASPASPAHPGNN